MTTHHSVTLDSGRTLDYVATAGTMALPDYEGEARADVFFVSYTLDTDVAPSKRPILFVFGGSLGARSLNLAMAANAGLLKERPEVQMLWQYGQLYEEQFGQCETARLPNVQARPFIDRMDLAYAMADVIICRSGALTISELCFVGKPAIFIPSPNVAEDHQSKNAQALVDAGAAWVVRDEEAKALAVVKALELLNDEPSRKQLGENIRKLAMPNAAARIAEEVLKLADQNSEK